VTHQERTDIVVDQVWHEIRQQRRARPRRCRLAAGRGEAHGLRSGFDRDEGPQARQAIGLRIQHLTQDGPWAVRSPCASLDGPSRRGARRLPLPAPMGLPR
jgi:hypothetical protein